ncbi:hypothetical protein [Verrucomicrobium spinosum]|uniref:hypothetical protein n=1 Tax=Verrucomicrobium spinosum TaxID=2736 RepID=UPI0001746412|nr:hypothetical protein [Verrucomicrobium spinosum]
MKARTTFNIMAERFKTQLDRLAESYCKETLQNHESCHAVAIIMLASGELLSKIRHETGLSTSRINYVRARFVHWGIPGLTLPMRLEAGTRRAVSRGIARRWPT